MYGFVARMRVKPEVDQALLEELEGQSTRIPGLVATYVYSSDEDPQELFMAVVFESREGIHHER